MMESIHMRRRAVVLGLSASAFTGAPFAQAPKKVVRCITPIPGGSGTEPLLRLMLKHVSDKTGQQYIVDNKPGGDGIIAGNDLLNSPADGSTIYFSTNTYTSGMAALRKKPPFEPATAFSAVTLLGFYTVYLFASPELPVNSVAELVAYGRQNPGKISIGVPSFTQRVATTLLGQYGKIEMTQVPYKGEPALVTDLISSRIQLTFASPSLLMPYVKQGKLKALATLMPKRTTLAPNVPTMEEAGLPRFNSAGWAGIFVAKGFPQDVKEKLAQNFAESMTTPEVMAAAEQIGFFLQSSSPPEMDAFLAKDVDFARKLVKEIGIPLE